MITAGIDVGARELVVVVQTQVHGKTTKPMTFDNDPLGHKALHNALKKRKVQRICLEATGVYHLDLAVALYDSGRFELMVLNPKAAKQYADAVMSRTKTDGVDAALLAGYAQTMPFRHWQRPDKGHLHIRACARRLAALTKQRTQAKNQLHALEATEESLDFIVDDVQLTIDQLAAQITRLRGKTLEIIQADASMNQTYSLLLSVKGIGEVSAIQLMGELLVLPEDMRAKQWVAMAGLDPSRHQSGSSVNKKTRISRVGNRYLRMALYMPALSASRHEANVHGYYQHLIEQRGLKKLQAVCAVMRKLLHAIHAMLRSRQPFDGSRFYTPPANPA